MSIKPTVQTASPAALHTVTTPTSSSLSTNQQSTTKIPQPIITPLPKLDPITFLSRLNVAMPLVLEIVQEITSLYSLWHSYEDLQSKPGNKTTLNAASPEERVISILGRMREANFLDLAHPSTARPASSTAKRKADP